MPNNKRDHTEISEEQPNSKRPKIESETRDPPPRTIERWLYSFYSRFFGNSHSIYSSEQVPPSSTQTLESFILPAEPEIPLEPEIFYTPELEVAIAEYNSDAFAKCLDLSPSENASTIEVLQVSQRFIIDLINYRAYKWLDKLIQDGKLNLDEKDANSRTLLHQAVKQGDLQLVKALIGLEANINAEDDFKMTPLHFAAQKGHREIVTCLLREGANVNVLNDKKQSPLFLSLYQTNGRKKEKTTFYHDIAALLLNNGAKYAILDINPFRLMLDAASYNAINLLKAYIAQGLSLNRVGLNQTTVLHEIIKKRSPFPPEEESNPIATLIQLGSSVDALDACHCTPAHYVNNVSDAVVLVKNKANLAIRNQENYTPLLAAVASENESVTEFLFQKTPHPLRGIRDQRNIMHIAKKNNKHSIFSKKLKTLIGLPKSYLDGLKQDLKVLFDLCKQSAENLNKKLIIIVGESHGDYHQYQKEKAILKAAKKYVGHLLLEYKETIETKVFLRFSEYMPYNYSKKNLSYTIFGIDKHRSSCDVDVSHEGLILRDDGMSEEITNHKSDAAVIVGAYHLHGLIEKPGTKLDLNQFFIVPFSLSKSDPNPYTDPRAAFCKNHTKSIFIPSPKFDFTQAKNVIEKLNKTDIKIGFKNR